MEETELSRDLKVIFATCSVFAIKHKLKTITVDNMLYNIFNFYFEFGSKEDLDKVVDQEFKKIPAASKMDLLETLKNLASERCKASSNEEAICNSDNIPVHEDLETILDAAVDISASQGRTDGVLRVDAILRSMMDWIEEELSVKAVVDYGVLDPEKAQELLELVTKEHLFLSPSSMEELFGTLKGTGVGVLKEKNIDYNDKSNEKDKSGVVDSSSTLNSSSKEDDEFEAWGQGEGVNINDVDEDSTTPTLDSFSRDMTKEAKDNNYDPVIGREDVVDSIIEILSKRRKPNVSITGKAGIGKSAIVERLAQRIASGDVPEALQGKRICSLNLNDLVAGTKFRGEYEERLKNIIKEVCNDKSVIIYIDELHNLVGNGSNSGNGDAANILKPYLARGEFQCIGSTTDEEYRKYIEKDAALNRRFTQVSVKEPSAQETVKILKGVCKKYEEFHHVKIGKDVIDTCVEWSQRYIKDKNQPDKAVEVMDMAGAIVKLRQTVDRTKQKELEEKLTSITDAKIKEAINTNFDEAEKIQAEESSAKDELSKEVGRINKELSDRKNWPTITVDDVAEAVGKISKVPVDAIRKTDREKLKEMKNSLETRVIGQQEAIDTVTNVINQNVLGLRADHRRPLGSFLLVGPSGVGKSLICKELATTFYGSDDSLIRIDGNTLKDDTSVNSLIGVGAGYVGFDSEPQLLQVKRKPNSVLLIDEVEKMSPKIFDIFLTILDEGKIKLADATTEVDFSSCVIIFTGNIGTKELAGDVNIGFNTPNREEKKKRNEAIVQAAIKRTFRPEFIGRLSSIVIFNELGDTELKKILELELGKIKKQFTKTKLSLKVSAKFKDHIVKSCDPKYGARDLRRLLEKNLITQVSQYMIENTEATKFNVDYDGNNVVVN
jgi:negative regulator of genetic competence ClpC/MecB